MVEQFAADTAKDFVKSMALLINLESYSTLMTTLKQAAKCLNLYQP